MFQLQYKVTYICSFSVNVGGKYIALQTNAVHSTWIHVAMVYKGSHDGEGLMAYKDVVRRVDNTEWSPGGSVDGSGEVMIGRLFNTSTDGEYARCQVDELLIWNIELYDDDIRKIYENI